MLPVGRESYARLCDPDLAIPFHQAQLVNQQLGLEAAALVVVPTVAQALIGLIERFQAEGREGEPGGADRRRLALREGARRKGRRLVAGVKARSTSSAPSTDGTWTPLSHQCPRVSEWISQATSRSPTSALDRRDSCPPRAVALHPVLEPGGYPIDGHQHKPFDHPGVGFLPELSHLRARKVQSLPKDGLEKRHSRTLRG